MSEESSSEHFVKKKQQLHDAAAILKVMILKVTVLKLTILKVIPLKYQAVGASQPSGHR